MSQLSERESQRLRDIEDAAVALGMPTRSVTKSMDEPSTPQLLKGQFMDLKAFGVEVVKACREYVEKQFAPRDERIAALEARIAEAETKGFGIRYAGVWRDGKGYEKGQFATHAGGLWHCNEDSDMKPGSGPHWTLAVKSGRDA